MNTSRTVTLVREYRKLTAADARAEGLRVGLSQEEMDKFLFSADSNAIWDAQQGRAYRKPVYTKPLEQLIVPMFDEMGFLSDEDYKRVMGKERKK